MGDHAEPALQIEALDLDHDAVRFVRQGVARLAPALDVLDHLVDAKAAFVMLLDVQPELVESVECPGLADTVSAEAVSLASPSRST